MVLKVFNSVLHLVGKRYDENLGSSEWIKNLFLILGLSISRSWGLSDWYVSSTKYHWYRREQFFYHYVGEICQKVSDHHKENINQFLENSF